jgi:hypothetical protein
MALLKPALMAAGVASLPEDAEAGFVSRGGKTFLEAYHGSPHDFGRFSLEHIGTGEGAQAYGHGLYFADAEDVARGYREQLKGSQVELETGEVKPYGEHFFNIVDAVQAEHNLHPDQARQVANAVTMDNLSYADVEGMGDFEQIYKTAIDANKGATETAGSLYKTHIDVQPDELLDWDKPLSEQPKALKAVRSIAEIPYEESSMYKQLKNRGHTDETIEKSREAYNQRMDILRESLQDFELGRTTGDSVVRMVTRLAAENNPEVSRILSQQGIKGIQYHDAMSRGSEGGTKNYVIFDDSLIKIAEKNGIPFEQVEKVAANKGITKQAALAGIIGGTMSPKSEAMGNLRSALKEDPLTSAFFGDFIDSEEFFDLPKSERKDYLLNAPNEATMELYGDPDFWLEGGKQIVNEVAKVDPKGIAQDLMGRGEAALTMGSGMASYLGGLATSAPAALMGDPSAARGIQESFTQQGTYTPRSRAGQEHVGAIGEALSGVDFEYFPDFVYEQTESPFLSSAAYTAVETPIVGDILGLGGIVGDELYEKYGPDVLDWMEGL